MRAYIDSDILIWHLRGEQKAADFLRKLQKNSEYRLWIGAIQRAEIVFFMKPQEEHPTELLLTQFQTAEINRTIIDQGGRLYRKWHPSHGIDVNDALLAATALESGGTIFTLNTRHYPMPELHVQKAW